MIYCFTGFIFLHFILFFFSPICLVKPLELRQNCQHKNLANSTKNEFSNLQAQLGSREYNWTLWAKILKDLPHQV